MLYRSTRGNHDVVTAHKTVHTDCYPDGGLFLPFRMPQLNVNKLTGMGTASPDQIVANVLNELFACGLTAWDVELAIGRRPIRLATVGRRVTAVELWQGSGRDVGGLVQALSDRMGGGENPTNWVGIAVGIALLFASYGMMQAGSKLRGQEKLDVAVAMGDFSTPMACWYAREMGLPIGNILCGCNANGSFWDLLNRGELATGDRPVQTGTPEASHIVPRNLERLIHGTLGVEENKRFLQICEKGGVYALQEEQRLILSRGFYAAVTSDGRVGDIIPGVYRTRGYVLGPYGALAYGAVQDFRATTGEERPTLLLAERSPVKDRALVSRLLRIKEADLEKRMTK